MNKIDKMFVKWSTIWLIYFSIFIFFNEMPYSTIFAITIFFLLWFKFCKSLMSLVE